MKAFQIGLMLLSILLALFVSQNSYSATEAESAAAAKIAQLVGCTANVTANVELFKDKAATFTGLAQNVKNSIDADGFMTTSEHVLKELDALDEPYCLKKDGPLLPGLQPAATEMLLTVIDQAPQMDLTPDQYLQLFNRLIHLARTRLGVSENSKESLAVRSFLIQHPATVLRRLEEKLAPLAQPPTNTDTIAQK